MVYPAANAAAVSAAAVMPARAADASLEDLRVICRMVHSLPEHRAYYTRHPGSPDFRPRGRQRIQNTKGTKGKGHKGHKRHKGHNKRTTQQGRQTTTVRKITRVEMNDSAAAF